MRISVDLWKGRFVFAINSQEYNTDADIRFALVLRWDTHVAGVMWFRTGMDMMLGLPYKWKVLK